MGRYRVGRERRAFFNSKPYRRDLQNAGSSSCHCGDLHGFPFLVRDTNPTIPQSTNHSARGAAGTPPSLRMGFPAPTAQGCVPLAVEPLQGQRPHRRIGQPVRCSPTCTNGKGIGDVSFSFLVLQVMPIASAPSSSDQLWPRGRCGCALVTVGHVWQALS